MSKYTIAYKFASFAAGAALSGFLALGSAHAAPAPVPHGAHGAHSVHHGATHGATTTHHHGATTTHHHGGTTTHHHGASIVSGALAVMAPVPAPHGAHSTTHHATVHHATAHHGTAHHGTH